MSFMKNGVLFSRDLKPHITLSQHIFMCNHFDPVGADAAQLALELALPTLRLSESLAALPTFPPPPAPQSFRKSAAQSVINSAATPSATSSVAAHSAASDYTATSNYTATSATTSSQRPAAQSAQAALFDFFETQTNPDSATTPPSPEPGSTLTTPRKATVWPGYLAPIIRLEGGTPVLEMARFGLVPHWAKDLQISRSTFNARSETVAQKPSFRDAWRRGQFCIVPAQAIFEPDWRTGRAVDTRIWRRDNRPLYIAGLWDAWHEPATLASDLGRQAQTHYSFTMLTLAAEEHELFRNFHRLDAPKRMVAMLDEAQCAPWLAAAPAAARDFLRLYPAHRLQSAPAKAAAN